MLEQRGLPTGAYWGWFSSAMEVGERRYSPRKGQNIPYTGGGELNLLEHVIHTPLTSMHTITVQFHFDGTQPLVWSILERTLRVGWVNDLPQSCQCFVQYSKGSKGIDYHHVERLWQPKADVEVGCRILRGSLFGWSLNSNGYLS